MSARSFGSLVMVASCAGAALGCYLVSLRVASERAALEAVETKIVAAQRDMRVLQTEIGTRGRLAQLERWNVKVLALSAPSAEQFLRGGFELARLTQPQHKTDFAAPVVLAAAPAAPRTAIGQRPSDETGQRATDDTGASATPSALLHTASLKTETREVPANPANVMPRPAGSKSTERPVTAAKPAQGKSVDRPGLAAAKSIPKKSVDKPSLAVVRPVTKAVRIAKTDPLPVLPHKAAPAPIKE
ncbi:MAG: hypothetical protein ABIS38_09870 [Sphingomicrobium sp.]